MESLFPKGLRFLALAFGKQCPRHHHSQRSGPATRQPHRYAAGHSDYHDDLYIAGHRRGAGEYRAGGAGQSRTTAFRCHPRGAQARRAAARGRGNARTGAGDDVGVEGDEGEGSVDALGDDAAELVADVSPLTPVPDVEDVDG